MRKLGFLAGIIGILAFFTPVFFMRTTAGGWLDHSLLAWYFFVALEMTPPWGNSAVFHTGYITIVVGVVSFIFSIYILFLAKKYELDNGKKIKIIGLVLILIQIADIFLEMIVGIYTKESEIGLGVVFFIPIAPILYIIVGILHIYIGSKL